MQVFLLTGGQCSSVLNFHLLDFSAWPTSSCQCQFCLFCCTPKIQLQKNIFLGQTQILTRPCVNYTEDWLYQAFPFPCDLYILLWWGRPLWSLWRPFYGFDNFRDLLISYKSSSLLSRSWVHISCWFCKSTNFFGQLCLCQRLFKKILQKSKKSGFSKGLCSIPGLPNTKIISLVLTAQASPLSTWEYYLFSSRVNCNYIQKV